MNTYTSRQTGGILHVLWRLFCQGTRQTSRLVATVVYICVHPELVGLDFQLGAKRQQVIDLAADRASRFLLDRGYKPEISRRFGDWWILGKMRRKARVHNYFAVEHSDLTHKVTDDIAEAARLFVDTLYQGQDG